MSKQQVYIVTDTTACLPGALAEQLDVEIVPVVLVFGKESFPGRHRHDQQPVL